jgi:hypothetical protein
LPRRPHKPTAWCRDGDLYRTWSLCDSELLLDQAITLLPYWTLVIQIVIPDTTDLQLKLYTEDLTLFTAYFIHSVPSIDAIDLLASKNTFGSLIQVNVINTLWCWERKAAYFPLTLPFIYLNYVLIFQGMGRPFPRFVVMSRSVCLAEISGRDGRSLQGPVAHFAIAPLDG